MAKGRGPWQEGRRAWDRLDRWHHERAQSTPGHPENAERALDALADVGQLRHLLDQAELVAVRTARQHRKSWAEIAVQLGVTRQSAWERWRDLDDPATAEPDVHTGSLDALDVDVDVEPRASTALPAGIISRAAGDLRRRGAVVVPKVIGMPGDGAFAALTAVGLGPVGLGPDGVVLTSSDLADKRVTDQSPESGARVPAGSPVTLWLRPGGGLAGVREPRRPKPGPRQAREMRTEPSGEAVG